jgi:hypothetical protein
VEVKEFLLVEET